MDHIPLEGEEETITVVPEENNTPWVGVKVTIAEPEGVAADQLLLELIQDLYKEEVQPPA